MMMEFSFYHFVTLGGPFMVPILICSILAMTISIHKFIYFQDTHPKMMFKFKTKMFQLIRTHQIKTAILECEKLMTPYSQVIKAGLLKFGYSREEIKADMDLAAAIEIPRIEKGFFFLSTIANLCPLMGMAGTISGIIVIFQQIQIRSASMTPMTLSDLSGGIWQALISTLAGLTVSIIVYVIHNVLLNQARTLTMEIETTSYELLNIMTRIEKPLDS